MINRNYLECLTCKERVTTRVAIGHGDRQEFAFPCMKCGVEIRFGMKLDQRAPSFEYDMVKGAKWVTDGIPPEPKHVRYLDGETLIPLNLHRDASAFLATVHLPKDLRLYDRDRNIRLDLALNVWPVLKQMVVHRERKNETLFDGIARKFGFKDDLQNWTGRFRTELRIFQGCLRHFRPFTSAEESLVLQRINYAESCAGSKTHELVQTLVSAHAEDKLTAEILRVRDAFMRVFPAISGIFQSLYWDDSKHSLDEFHLAEKRFDELKTLYIDCFETLCRLSVVAATLEGVIQNGKPEVPTKKGSMATVDFQTMPNGSKPDILHHLPIAEIFVPVMNSKLRNGVGHNSAGYNVQKDCIFYSNHNKKGVQEFQMPYIRFCEAIMRIYRLFEVGALYGDWLRVKVYVANRSRTKT